MVISVRPFCVVKNDVIIDRFDDFICGAIFVSIKFFAFHIRKEGFNNRIIVGDMCARKRLRYMQRL